MGGEESEKFGQFSATDVLKKKVIDFTINQCFKACEKQEPVSDETYETGFIRGVKLAKSMLWKYTPNEVREPIRELYTELENKIKEIEEGELSQENKRLNKTVYADQVSMQVLEFLLVVLQYSPMSTEYKQMEVFGDFKELIDAIRQEKAVKLFSGDIDSE